MPFVWGISTDGALSVKLITILLLLLLVNVKIVHICRDARIVQVLLVVMFAWTTSSKTLMIMSANLVKAILQIAKLVLTQLK